MRVLMFAKGEIISLTDDDAAPHQDWLERIESHFLADDRVGAVGGRDFIYAGTQLKQGTQRVVGKIQWFGRLIGNHEFGVGEAREVDILKGVNMSFRQSAILDLRFDERMRGTGAQVHFELAFSFALKRAGWKLIYDPRVAVNHYRAQRFDEDQRDQFNSVAMINKVHNETLCLLEYLPPLQGAAFLIWGLLIWKKRTSWVYTVLASFTQRKNSIDSKIIGFSSRTMARLANLETLWVKLRRQFTINHSLKDKVLLF